MIGDFTGKIGDPTGKNEQDHHSSEEDVKENAETYSEQVFKILDQTRQKLFLIQNGLIDLGAFRYYILHQHHTVARMLERDDFAKRYKANQPISIHEFLYPLLQGYDSVALKADIELAVLTKNLIY